MNTTLKEYALAAGMLVGAVVASVGAYRLVDVLIGNRWGVLPDLAGGVSFVLVLTLGLQQVDKIRDSRLERHREAMRDYLRRQDSN